MDKEREEFLLMLSRMQREAVKAVLAKIAARQQGEAFK
jgi:hypothetical protein